MKAQQIDMFLVGFGSDMSAGHAHFYAAGTTTDKDIYTTKTKAATLANPYTLDTNGRAADVIYADGWYKIVLHQADGTLFDTWDQLYYGVLEQTDSRSGANTAVADTYTILATDDVIECNASSGAFTVTIIDATTITDHKRFTIKKVDATANAVTVDGTGSQTIDGALTKVLSRQYDTIVVMLNDAGTGWLVEEAFEVANADRLDDHDASHTPTANTIPISDAAAVTLATGWIPDYMKVYAEGTDTTPGFLSAKVDDSTIEAYATSHYLRVKATGITTAHLKNASVVVSTAAAENITVTGGQWCHWPQVKVTGALQLMEASVASAYDSASYLTNIYLHYTGGGAGSAYAQFLYHTASGTQVWIFGLREKDTGKIRATSVAIDHPCFSSSGDPKITPHPFPGYKPDLHDILVCTPTKEEIDKIMEISGSKPVFEFIIENCVLVANEKASWPTEEIAIQGREDSLYHVVIPVTWTKIEKEPYMILCSLEESKD